jgi:hypothetical protein
MKNIFANFSIENFTNNVKTAFARFPLSFVASVLIFLIFVYTIYNWDIIPNQVENILYKSILSLVTIYFLSIWVYLLSEKFNLTRFITCFSQLWSILFWVLFYFSFEQNLFNNFYSEELVYIIITYVWVISFIFVTTFIKSLINNDVDNDKYYTYFNSVASKILMTVIVWWALTLLGVIAISTIFALFELTTYVDESKFFWYWVAFSLSLFTPIYFLTIAPEKEENLTLLDKIKENKFYNFLSNYIALPFIFIYFFILYAYSLKVLLNFSDWPKWIISWMVIWFSLFWYLIYIFSHAFEKKSEFVRIFRKVFPFAVLFQTPMLFYAIYLRINQYDFTINRYLVVVFWIYLVLISLYFIFSKKKFLLFIPLLLTTFIIIISIWPWWVYSFPEGRQLELLKPDLVEAKILQWTQIVLPKDEKDIEDKLSGKIYENVNYLCDFHGCESMSNIFWTLLEDIKKQDKIDWEKTHEDEIKRLKSEISNYSGTDKEILDINKRNLLRIENQRYPWIYFWTYTSKLLEKLKVKPYYAWDIVNQKYIYFSLDYTKRNSMLKVTNFDYIFPLWTLYWAKYFSDTVEPIENDLYYSKYDIDNSKLIIYKNKVVLEEFDLNSDFTKIYDLNFNNINSNGGVDLKELVSIEKVWKIVDIKILLEDFSILNPKYDWIDTSLANISWKILLKEHKK